MPGPVDDDQDRSASVLERLRHLLTPDQLAAVTAVRILDPDAIASLDDDTLRMILRHLADPTMTAAPDPEAIAASNRFLEEIM